MRLCIQFTDREACQTACRNMRREPSEVIPDQALAVWNIPDQVRGGALPLAAVEQRAESLLEQIAATGVGEFRAEMFDV